MTDIQEIIKAFGITPEQVQNIKASVQNILSEMIENGVKVSTFQEDRFLSHEDFMDAVRHLDQSGEEAGDQYIKSAIPDGQCSRYNSHSLATMMQHCKKV